MTNLKYLERPPTEPKIYPDPGDIAGRLCADDMLQIAEIFSTPLNGSYNWNYREADARISKLYELGKARNWNASADIDWSQTFPRTESALVKGTQNPYLGWGPYEKLSEEERVEFTWHLHAWTTSQFLHGEQGALLVSSQLVSCAPTYEAKLYASSQTFDEARHVEVFGRYLIEKVRVMYPVSKSLKTLLDRTLADPRWDLKFIGMQLVIESLAMAAFNVQRQIVADPLLRSILDLVLRDEARHVAFGVTYMEQFVRELSEKERDERAEFALEACRIMRERIVPLDVYEHYGFDPAEGRRRFLAAGEMDKFRNFLFTRIMPNLNKVGLLTDRVKPSYEELGLLMFANMPHDGELQWSALEAPLAAG